MSAADVLDSAIADGREVVRPGVNAGRGFPAGATIPAERPRQEDTAVRNRLRSATAAVHEALHQAEPFLRIARGALDRAGYAELLCSLSRFHRAMAPVCRSACAAIEAADLLRHAEGRLERLRRDLVHVGVEAPPAPPPPREAAAEGFAVGCLYTVQGSTLGGAVIHRQLESLLPTPAGREFFGRTETDGALWRDLCARLERYGGNGDRLPALVAGARSAFEFFRSCLEDRR